MALQDCADYFALHDFCELRHNGVLRSSHQTWSSGIMLVVEGVVPPQRRTWGLGALSRGKEDT